MVDTRRVQDLSRIERSFDVTEEANARLTAIEKVLARGSDILKVATPIVVAIRACFGIYFAYTSG
jgi:hypothetical protein